MVQAIHDKHSLTNTLETITQQFDHWRSTREKKEPIPERLWALAIALTTQYGFTKIVRALKLSGGHFRKRLQSEGTVNKQNTIQLIECQNPTFPKPLQSFEQQQSHSIESTCKNLSIVKLHGLSIADIQLVITQLMGDS
jgi:hypothetical protein